MTSLQAALDSVTDDASDEFSRGHTTERTAKIEPPAGEAAPLPARRRTPEDSEVDYIVLQRSLGQGKGQAEFKGPTSWALASIMLEAWARALRSGEDDAVAFAICFGDGETFRGTLAIRKRRSLAAHCRRLETFRASFCPTLSDTAAAGMLSYFLAHYVVPQPSQVKKLLSAPVAAFAP